MLLKFLVYFLIMFQIEQVFSVEQEPVLMRITLEPGCYFQPLLYRIYKKNEERSLFLLGIDYADYPPQVYHPFLYTLIFGSDAFLFEFLNEDYIESYTQYSKEYLELGVDVNEEIERLRAEIAQGQKAFYSFADRIKLILQEKGYEKSLFGLDDPATLFEINKLQRTALTDLPRSESEIVKIQKLFMLGDSQGLYDIEYNLKNIYKKGGPTEEQFLKVMNSNRFLLNERNELWYDKIRKLMQMPRMRKANFFGIVGFSHLLEANSLSLTNLFKGKKFEVERVTNQHLDSLMLLNQ